MVSFDVLLPTANDQVGIRRRVSGSDPVAMPVTGSFRRKRMSVIPNPLDSEGIGEGQLCV